MRCPHCAGQQNRVVDSRLSKDGSVIRRRRACADCERRFTTYERIEEYLPVVVKKDGRRESFDRHKVTAGIQRACEKRPISMTTIAELVDDLERQIQEEGNREVPSTWVGEWIMDRLRSVDEVAYVRFASVYRQFRDVDEFYEEAKALLAGRRSSPFNTLVPAEESSSEP